MINRIDFKKSGLLESLIVIFLFLLITILFTWPLVKNLPNGFITDGSSEGDFFQYIWNIKVLKTQLSTFSNPFVTSTAFYPENANMLMTTYTPIIGLFSYFFNNDILALNIFLMLSFVLSGCGAYFFAKKFINNSILCFLSSFLFSFSSYKMVHLLGHYNLMLTATIPFFFISFFEAFEFKAGILLPKIINKKHFLACVVLGILSILSDYYITFYILYSILFYVIFNKFIISGKIDWKHWKNWVYVVLFFIVSHIAIRLLRLQGIEDKATFYFQADLISIIIPYLNNAFFPVEWMDYLNKKAEVMQYVEGVVFTGYIFLVCFLISFILRNHAPKNTLISAFSFISFCLFMMIFPGLKVAGKEYLNLPASIFNLVPFINNIRCTSRFLCILMLFLPVLVFYYFQFIPIRSKLISNLLFVFIGVLIFLEHFPRTYGIYDVRNVSKAYSFIGEKYKSKVAMFIPTGVSDGGEAFGEFKSSYLYYQTLMNTKMIGGYTSRVNKKTKDFYLSDSVMTKLFKLKPLEEMTFELHKEELDLFYKKFQPDIFILEQRNGKYEDFLNKLLKNQDFNSFEIDNIRIIELKKR